MPTDLEKFLQQAAEKLAQKMQDTQAQQPARPQPAPQRTLQPATPSRPLQPARNEVEIIEAEVVSNSRLAGDNPLSTLDTRHNVSSNESRPTLARGVSDSDDRMAQHVQEVFEHQVTHIGRASSALSEGQAVVKRAPRSSALVAMLKNNETLKAAFIASELFKRKS